MAASETHLGTGGRGEDRKQTPEEIAEERNVGFTRQHVLPNLLWVLLFVFTAASAVGGPSRQFHIDYTVAVSNPETNLFHVTAKVENLRQSRLQLSLPAWTPGWYLIENYAKHLLRFRISDAKGRVMPYLRTRLQTWSVETRGNRQIKVEFDYRADTLMANQAWITNDFAFFTGTQLFLMAEGHRASPSAVHFRIPAGWKIICALQETSDPLTFTAPDYDTLVDAPTEMGHFDVSRFEVENKPHYFVATPAGAFSSDSTRKFIGMLEKIATTQSAIFGGLPYDKYVYFYFFWPPGATRQGYLEHSSSHVVFGPPPDFVENDLERLAWTAAHEFFHVWNVKRLRPLEMWPYDYSRANLTPLLWVAEGFCDYYSSVARYRAGLMSRRDFLDAVGANIHEVESNTARDYLSPAESSVATWLTYGSAVEFGDDYYEQGQNLGALLDLSIRHDSHGKAGLDDVMRSLYRDCYQRGNGFGTEDMIGSIKRLTRRDYHDFFRRYVWGVEVPDYDAIYGYAGFRVEKTLHKAVLLGFAGRLEGKGLQTIAVTPGSPAAQAGLFVGDVITKIDEQPPDAPALVAALRSHEMIGKTIKLAVQRDGATRELSFKVGSYEREVWRIVEVAQPTVEQLGVREAWLSLGGRE